MPKVTWNELSDIRHSISNDIESLYRLELSVRDYFRGVNQNTNTCYCLNQIGRLKDNLMKTVSDIDTLVTKHEAEDE